MWSHHNKKGRGVAEIKIREEEVEEDGVVVHRRYANLARSLDMPYSLRNIRPGRQATHEARCGAFEQSPKEQRSKKLQKLEGKLVHLE